jgi:predicted DCC family thiol-disulfide oxidoreductase YuxK
MTPELARACAQAVHVITPDRRVLRAGRASLYVLERAGWTWRARILGVPPLVWLVELGYRLVAANRDLAGRLLFRS